MAEWLRDDQASVQLGRNIFRLPYPGGTWREEKARNADLLLLMEMSWRAVVLGEKSKSNKKLNKDEEKLLDYIAECLAGEAE